MLSLFRELEHKNGYEVIEAVLKYLLERGEMSKTSFVNLVEKELSPKIGDKIMTVAEQFFAEGAHIAHLETARALFLKGMSIANIAEVTTLSVEEIQAEAEKIQQKNH